MGVEPETAPSSSAVAPSSPKRLPSQATEFNLKRKHEGEGRETHVASRLEVFVGGGESPDFEVGCGSRKSRDVVRSPLGEVALLKRLRLASREEMRTLRVQRAMISDEDGDRQIHIAVAQEDLDMVKKLCVLMKRAGISMDITNFLRQTALHLAVILGNAQIVRVLFDHGASLLVRDRKGNSILHLAAKNFREDVFRLLLSHPHSRAILDAADYEGYTALHHATLRNNVSAVDCLHRVGADMNALDGKSGRSSLIHAVLAEDADMVRLLLECGACPERSDYSGQSALEFALQTSNRDVIRMIERETPFRIASDVNRCADKTSPEQSKIRRNDSQPPKRKLEDRSERSCGRMRTGRSAVLRTSTKMSHKMK